MRLHPDSKFDAIVANTTWYFRANSTNLLSAEYLALVKSHLNANGIYFYNTTESARVQRTACLAFPYGAKFTNHMIVSVAPLAWDFDNWRNTLASYKIDGKPVLDMSSQEGRARLDDLMFLKKILAGADVPGLDKPIESCKAILQRTADDKPVTDDNMGSEYRHLYGME